MKLSRRLVIVLAITACVLLVIAGIGVYGLLSGPPDRPEPTATPTPDPSEEGHDAPSDPLAPILITSDPESFARSVALALFVWDTTTIADPGTIVAHLMDVAEPGGTEAHGLYQDVQRYLPTAAQWRQLRQYDTRQRLSIDTIVVPESWEQVVSDPANNIMPGVIAFTIDGTRVREGGWHGEETTKHYPVTFTLFLTCPADSDRCFLLRLSALDRSLR